MKKLSGLMTILGITFFVTACSSGGEKSQERAQAEEKKQEQMAKADLKSPKKNVSGEILFKESQDGIKVIAEVKGLRPESVHGFHVHENGKCEAPGFKSAGEHLNPDSKPHAGPGAEKKHAGDFGNLVANKQGVARKEIFLKKDELQSLDTVMNKAIILHAGADDLTSQPSGNSGDRLACGIIKSVKAI